MELDAHDEAALALADGLAADVLKRLAPLRFAVAGSDAEREAAERLRYRAVIERGWATPADYPDGRERDGDDTDAIHLAGWDGAVPIATCRLVLPAPGRPLPTEAAFDLTVEPRGRVVDIGRVTVAREYSETGHRVLAGLLARSWLELRERGFAHACGAFAAAPALRLYRRMGFETTILAPPRCFWGALRVPMRWEVARAAPTLARRWGTDAVPDLAAPR